jgi:hypothetical protein
MAKKATREVLEFLFVGPLFSIYKELNVIRRKLNNVATQAEVDALSQKVGAIGDQLTKGIGEVKDEISRLETANPSIDLSALSERLDGVGALAQNLDDVVPDTVGTGDDSGSGGDETPSEPSTPDTATDPGSDETAP